MRVKHQSELIEKHLAWHLINGRLSTQRAASVGRYVDRLCSRLRPLGGERARQDEARAYYATQRASGAAPISEKTLRKQAAGR